MSPIQMRVSRLRRPALLAVLAVCLMFTTGCGVLRPGPTGALTLRGAHEPDRTLPTAFDTALYSFNDPDSVTIVLIQGPATDPDRAMTIRLFWQPDAGRTPLTRDATNALVRYARFETTADGDRHVSVYTGAGFLWPHTRPGRPTMRAGMRQATLRLIDATFDQPEALIEATLAGRLTARRDDVAALRIVRELEAAVSEALSYPRFVQSDQHAMGAK